MRQPRTKTILPRASLASFRIWNVFVDDPVQPAELLKNDGAHEGKLREQPRRAAAAEAPDNKSQLGRKSRIAAAISAAWVSSAKWPVSKKRTVASGMSRLKASAPGGRKNGSFLPQIARKRGL